MPYLICSVNAMILNKYCNYSVTAVKELNSVAGHRVNSNANILLFTLFTEAASEMCSLRAALLQHLLYMIYPRLKRKKWEEIHKMFINIWYAIKDSDSLL